MIDLTDALYGWFNLPYSVEIFEFVPTGWSSIVSMESPELLMDFWTVLAISRTH